MNEVPCDPAEVCLHVEVQLALRFSSWSNASCAGAAGALPLLRQAVGSWRNFFFCLSNNLRKLSVQNLNYYNIVCGALTNLLGTASWEIGQIEHPKPQTRSAGVAFVPRVFEISS